MRNGRWSTLILAAASLAAASCTPDREVPDVQQLLIDRMQIEDLVNAVYDNVETASTADFDKYYVPGAVFAVNGTTYTGKQAILAYHREVAATSPMLSGTFHMLVDNLRVNVDGDMATARLLFTGVLSESLRGDPRLFKHGREYDLLERQSDGSWKIAKRVIVSDASAESDFAGIVRPGEDYDILEGR